MAPIKIVVTDRYTPESLEFIRSNLSAEIVFTEQNPNPEKLVSADALLIRSRTRIDSKVLKSAPQLKLIVTATSGFDHIDLEQTVKMNIQTLYTPRANTQSAAELTLFLILAALRRATDCSKALRSGLWKDSVPQGFELSEKIVGLIGLGKVGSKVAEICQAFGAKIIAYDPYQKDEVFEKLKINRFGLTEVFAQADVLTLHVPLTAETRRMIRSETLELTKDGLIFINTSRGKVVDESALVLALETGQISAAGLDVYEHEPLARESRLRKMANVVLTPHIGAYTEEAYARASLDAAQKLVTFFNSGKISDNLPLQ